MSAPHDLKLSLNKLFRVPSPAENEEGFIMNKTYNEAANGKTISVQAPVIATVTAEETAINYPMADWLSHQQVVGEQGLVLKRIGGIALTIVGIPVGIFGLLCFPGLFFWILGPVGLAMIGQGILLCFSKRAKKPEDAFKKLFGEVLFNIDGTSANYSPYYFNSSEGMKNRIKKLYPIENLPVDDGYVNDFIQKMGTLIETMFANYGTIAPQENKVLSYSATFDPDIKILATANNVATVSGTVNIIRKSSIGEREIAEMHIVTNFLNLGGYYVPLNPLPSLTLGQPLPGPAELAPAAPAHALTA
jgi:hypothetical protein